MCQTEGRRLAEERSGPHPASRCWVCGSSETEPLAGRTVSSLTAAQLRITDKAYGSSLQRVRCVRCGFAFCPSADDALERLYEDMVDPTYVADQGTRAPQFDEVLNALQRCGLPAGGTLLDVGCGAGGLVERAINRGIVARGLDPSRFLVSAGQKRGLPLSSDDLSTVADTFDAVVCVDVIEHVTDPVGLLRALRGRVRSGGLVAIATPDAGSLTARLLRRRWWHIRPAHVGYFDERSLELALTKADLRQVLKTRPSWFFPGRYLGERLAVYSGPVGTLVGRALADRTVRVNPRDSLLVIARAV
jgi:SAM-dependent methyltransferase